jgi:hypothetical protein
MAHVKDNTVLDFGQNLKENPLEIQRGMLQRMKLQRTNATTNSFLSIKSGYYNEHNVTMNAEEYYRPT